ncbi:hypothetical protein LXL04_017294 [Taraxacum kok-saghyz]
MKHMAVKRGAFVVTGLWRMTRYISHHFRAGHRQVQAAQFFPILNRLSLSPPLLSIKGTPHHFISLHLISDFRSRISSPSNRFPVSDLTRFVFISLHLGFHLLLIDFPFPFRISSVFISDFRSRISSPLEGRASQVQDITRFRFVILKQVLISSVFSNQKSKIFNKSMKLFKVLSYFALGFIIWNQFSLDFSLILSFIGFQMKL